MKVGIHCIDCLGTGLEKKPDMIGSYRYDLCKKCRGLGKQMTDYGSGEHRIAANIGTMKQYFDREKRK